MMLKRGHMGGAAAAALVVLLTVAGCSPSQPTGAGNGDSGQADSSQSEESKALETYVEGERKTLPDIMAASSGAYSDIIVESEPPAGVVFTYTFTEQTDPAAATDYFESIVPDLQDSVDSAVFPAMESYGVTGDLSVTYVYLNPDGSEVWSKTLTQS